MRSILHNAAMNLLNDTLDLVKASPVPVSSICEDIGVTPRWLQKVVAGEIKNPGVKSIQELHDRLKEAAESSKGSDAA